MRIRTLTVGALAVVTALTLAGCTNPGEEMEGMDHGSASAAPDASAKAIATAQADIDFAMNMIAHHQQAVEMSDVLLAKEGTIAQVAELAERIKAAQQPRSRPCGNGCPPGGRIPRWRACITATE